MAISLCLHAHPRREEESSRFQGSRNKHRCSIDLAFFWLRLPFSFVLLLFPSVEVAFLLLPPYLLRRGLSLNLDLTHQANLLSKSSMPCLLLSSTEIPKGVEIDPRVLGLAQLEDVEPSSQPWPLRHGLSVSKFLFCVHPLLAHFVRLCLVHLS